MSQLINKIYNFVLKRHHKFRSINYENTIEGKRILSRVKKKYKQNCSERKKINKNHLNAQASNQTKH